MEFWENMEVRKRGTREAVVTSKMKQRSARKTEDTIMASR